MIDLQDMEKDALKETGNVGIGNAATALSKMLDKRIDISIPETTFVPLEKVANQLGGPATIIASIYLEIEGDVQGEALLAFTQDGMKNIIDLVLGNPPGTTKIISEIEESAFKEMANIVTGAYLNSLGDFLNMRILPSVPHSATDMAQAVIDYALIKVAQHSDSIMVVSAEFTIEGQKINGKFLIILTDDSLKKIIATINKKYGL